MTEQEATITVTIQVGNTDNKLSQQEWSEFVKRIHVLIIERVWLLHFNGGSNWDDPWQNACWVVELDSKRPLSNLTDALKHCREVWNQDSIAITCGKTIFV